MATLIDTTHRTHAGRRVGASNRSPEELRSMFLEFHRTRERRLRNQLVEAHLHLAEYYVRRYAQRNVSREDLHQLAFMAVIHAVERYDPSLGVGFRTFASRTIEGECKRYLRDRSWSVRPPRRVQELHLALRRADEELSHVLGRSPNLDELSEHLDASHEELLEAMEAASAQQAASLEAPAGGGDEPDGGATLGDLITGQVEEGYSDVEQRRMVAGLVDGLCERDRRILYLRFYRNLTQPEIARLEGVSQSYLSRLLRRILEDLRCRA